MKGKLRKFRKTYTVVGNEMQNRWYLAGWGGEQKVCKHITEYSVFVISDEMGENVDG